MTDGVSDDDDNSESKSVDSMANRKRKLNTILGSNKRMHVEYPAKAETTDNDSDSNHEHTDRTASINDNDDCGSSRMSDFDDGELLEFLYFYTQFADFFWRFLQKWQRSIRTFVQKFKIFENKNSKIFERLKIEN